MLPDACLVLVKIRLAQMITSQETELVAFADAWDAMACDGAEKPLNVTHWLASC
jgi:hypothetical protein